MFNSFHLIECIGGIYIIFGLNRNISSRNVFSNFVFILVIRNEFHHEHISQSGLLCFKYTLEPKYLHKMLGSLNTYKKCGKLKLTDFVSHWNLSWRHGARGVWIFIPALSVAANSRRLVFVDHWSQTVEEIFKISWHLWCFFTCNLKKYC